MRHELYSVRPSRVLTHSPPIYQGNTLQKITKLSMAYKRSHNKVML